MATMKFTKTVMPMVVILSLCWGTLSAEGGVILTTLASFTGTNGANPDAGLIQAADGQLYGTTTGGGTSNLGTIFRLSPSSGTLVSLASFTGANGAFPKAGLVQRTNADFSLYGTAFSGGASNLGAIFQITTNGALSAIVSFRGTNGANPQAALAAGNDGKFYGTTYYGGTYDWPNGYGVVFQVTTNGTLASLASFNNTNGADPCAPLRLAGDANFYGTTQLGGTAGYGTVFKVGPGGTITTLASFNGTNGAYPFGGLVPGLDGKFYGTTLSGGTSNRGTVFQVTTNGVLTPLVSFLGTNGADPFAGLCLSRDGDFYGTTAQGGANAAGTVFRINPNGVLTTLVSFASTNGANPYAGVIQGQDGSLYGTTGGGGDFGLGTVYRLSLPLGPITQTVSQNGDMLALSWEAVIGQTYRVQSKTNLDQILWSDWVSAITATNATMTLFDAIGPDPQRFYRVVLLP
jgi:uncharacterized repeat protein (TIGR03803 family)